MQMSEPYLVGSAWWARRMQMSRRRPPARRFFPQQSGARAPSSFAAFARSRARSTESVRVPLNSGFNFVSQSRANFSVSRAPRFTRAGFYTHELDDRGEAAEDPGEDPGEARSSGAPAAGRRRRRRRRRNRAKGVNQRGEGERNRTGFGFASGLRLQQSFQHSQEFVFWTFVELKLVHHAVGRSLGGPGPPVAVCAGPC
ncbi:hypothetical protein AOLI_G00252150 [Acnodon oligacanthus]